MPTDQEPRTMSAERLQELRSETWEPTHDELLKELDAQMAAHAETLNERDAARWERDRAISQLAETRELHQQCRTRILELDAELAETREQLAQAQTQLDTSPYDLVPEALQQRDSALEQLTETRGIARELAEALQSRKCICNGTGLQHKTGYTHYETDAGEECPAYHYGPCPRCELARASLAKARAAGILNTPKG